MLDIYYLSQYLWKTSDIKTFLWKTSSVFFVNQIFEDSTLKAILYKIDHYILTEKVEFEDNKEQVQEEKKKT